MCVHLAACHQACGHTHKGPLLPRARSPAPGAKAFTANTADTQQAGQAVGMWTRVVLVAAGLGEGGQTQAAEGVQRIRGCLARLRGGVEGVEASTVTASWARAQAGQVGRAVQQLEEGPMRALVGSLLVQMGVV
eukprot:gnl/Chilomastix_caulleri/7955.p3 GENE.gnl/Chilomastix_caulleri/7955~~gnl/Chilomastix_caulleri/7955.p3  ORF type:complete len:134 (+),score=33.43 gnl/Chilomastix_caulleri/7955:173-574(+)